MVKKVGILFLCFLLLFTGCRPKVDPPVLEKGEVEQTKEDLSKHDMEKSQKSLNEEVAEILNAKHVFDPGENHGKDALSSYYKRTALSQGEELLYDEIYQAVLDYQPKLTLTKQIPVSQLQKIMNIIILDTPELFHMENKYSYSFGLDEKVEKIHFHYLISEDEYKQKKEYFLNDNNDTISGIRKSNSYESLIKAIGQAGNILYSSNNKREKKEPDDPEDVNTAYSMLCKVKGEGNSFGITKYLVYLLREGGVEAFLKVGILSFENPLMDYGYDFQTYRKFKRDEMYKEYSVGNEHFIELDLKGLHAYLCVKLTEKDYFNYDPFVSRAMSGHLIRKGEKDGSPFPTFEQDFLGICSDYRMAQTRSFFINEKLLGITPLCSSDNFMESKRAGVFLPVIPKQKMVAVLGRVVDDFYRKGMIYYQFSDYETYENFIERFDSAIDFYNKSSNNAIKSYQTYYDPYLLLFVAYDLTAY